MFPVREKVEVPFPQIPSDNQTSIVVVRLGLYINDQLVVNIIITVIYNKVIPNFLSFGMEEFYSYEEKNSTKKTKQGNKIQHNKKISLVGI